jgi:hypothetical protein
MPASRAAAFDVTPGDHFELIGLTDSGEAMAEEQEGGEPPPLAGAGAVLCLMA